MTPPTVSKTVGVKQGTPPWRAQPPAADGPTKADSVVAAISVSRTWRGPRTGTPWPGTRRTSGPGRAACPTSRAARSSPARSPAAEQRSCSTHGQG
eukprot:scaffold141810_cov238-Phaeocystis_antarctica.AAC.1